MQDVARHAGVSVMTVSNVVNAHPHVREATRLKVLDAIDELGYHVNTAARTLRQGRSGVIGLAVPEIDRPYFGLLASLLIDRAARSGYELVVVQTSARRERELGAVARARLRSYDGLILSAVDLHDDDAALLRDDFPVVVLGERTFSHALDRVEMANEKGTALATRHLIERGCTRIAMIGGADEEPELTGVATLRARGYLSALREAGLQPGRGVSEHDLVRSTPFTLDGSYRVTRELLADLPDIDGLVCATDLIAIGAIRAVQDLGRSVPEDVCVVGFDDVPLSAFLTPSLTSIAPDHAGMADAAISMLIERIDGTRTAGETRAFIGAVRLVERESTGPTTQAAR